MNSSFILSMMIAASAHVSASKELLHNDPAFAGSVIKYCEKLSPKTCETIDRSKEATPNIDRVKALKEIGSKLDGASSDFSSLSIQNDSLELSLEFKQQKVKK